MAERQTRNVSLPAHQDKFVEALVESGRYRTASEVVRDGLRLLEEAEHRRLLEKWIYEGLSPKDDARLPVLLKERATAHFKELIDHAMGDVEHGDVNDGPTVMARLRAQLETPSD